MTIYASWYHKKNILPSYIVFHIKPSGKDFSYKLLFDMDTLELIKIRVTLKISQYRGRLLTIMVYKDNMNAISHAIETLPEKAESATEK